MSLREQLKNRIEEERVKLNVMIAGGGKVGDIYHQSLVLDQLIEQYMDCSE